ncbi:MAG: N-6 DNA methylase [Candidatus Lokiarchaeota archaeon]|nr:N-6 DNA methylase [Candidatus Lokiarchaeota archaeon]MBD3341155.1 N-6 DNA methylase [Candidatus Lokiarchaeota archaeon]
MVKIAKFQKQKENRRHYGAHLTSKSIFYQFIEPNIQNKLYNYLWTDMYCGQGNLILPILENIPKSDRNEFFRKHIYLFDIQPEMVAQTIKNAINLGISVDIAKENIIIRDNLLSFPEFLKSKKFPLYHITNPPYLYLGYIRKHKKTQKYLRLFENENDGYQDLYQIAMMKDLRNRIKNLIYIIPTNFLYGASVSNKFRNDFLKHYEIQKMIIYESQIFEFTGTNICIGFFTKKKIPQSSEIRFNGKKIKANNAKFEKIYILKPKYNYRAGSEFKEFTERKTAPNPLKVNYYLLNKEVKENKGDNELTAIDANVYQGNRYKKIGLKVNEKLKKKIESNILYVRTVDTGSMKGRVGLRVIEEDFKAKAIYVSGNTYRTHPIQIFLEPTLSIEDQLLLRDFFNFVLEYFRKILDSDFLTTYKYSDASYTRKYLGLNQTRSLIETFSILTMKDGEKKELKNAIYKKEYDFILKSKNEQEKL